MGAEQFQIHTRLIIEAVGKGFGHHINEISITDLVLAKQYQVSIEESGRLGTVNAAFGGKIDLTSNDGTHAFRLAGLVKCHRTIHYTVVSKGNRRLSQFFGTARDFLDAAGTVQQTILTMQMQMYKFCHSYSIFRVIGNTTLDL